jgi:predicted DNA-binding transcriptional regulator AlpA
MLINQYPPSMAGMKKNRTGPHVAGKARQQQQHPVAAAAKGAPAAYAHLFALQQTQPTQLAEVQLIDGRTAAHIGGMSISWWHEKVAEGIAPQPVFRAPRCTRWRLMDVARFWRQYRPGDDRAALVVDQAVTASGKAMERRRAKAVTRAGGQ